MSNSPKPHLLSGFLRGAIFGFAALLIAIQFIRPARTNPPVIEANTLEAAVSVPPDVERIISVACNDCHSNLTRWPKYSRVAPISWFVINHVNEGRRHMNFSAWLRQGVQDPAEYTRERLASACREVRTGDMPLYSYRLVHVDSRLTAEDVQLFCNWANSDLH